MKIRQGFVTNSSSSSFICEVCNDVKSGWDACLSDVFMVECDNNHVLCKNHVEYNLTEEDKTAIFKKYNKEHLENYDTDLNDYLKAKNMTLDEFIDNNSVIEIISTLNSLGFSETNDREYAYRNEYIAYDIENSEYIPSEICPICQNKVVLDSQLIEYACEKLGVSLSELKELTREALLEK